MKEKIRILFYNIDGAGVNYFRTLTPAMEIERNHSDDFFVEINPKLDFNSPDTIEYLKTFNIIHYHRQLVDDSVKMVAIANELKAAGVILIMDIDDYWNLHKKHPLYDMNMENNSSAKIVNNLKIADYCTTTTDIFANEINKITKRNNTQVLLNSIDPIWMKQFQNNWKPDPDGRIRITYMAGSCYDNKTEIFTENGWKFFKDLEKDEKVATLNSVTNLLEYQQPTEYINELYSGDMYYGKNSLIDFAVTPNHNMYAHKSKSLNRKKPFNFELNKMENLVNYDLTFKKNCDWIGNDDEYIIIPKHLTTKQHTDKCGEIKIKMDDWLKFFGFWMGDGWTTNGECNQVGVCGYKKIGIDTMKEIKGIFDNYGISSTYSGENTLRFFNTPLYNYLHQFGGANEKHIPKSILNLNKNKLEIFLEYYLRADGHIRKNGRKTAYTSSESLANNLNELALKIGLAATITNRGIRNNNTVLKNGRTIKANYDSHAINFYLSSKKNNLMPTMSHDNIMIEKYEGNIFCVTVPNHILYVRRNEKSYWCGNSHEADFQQLNGTMNLLISDPELTDKFKVIIAGWDTEGDTADVTFNQEFGKLLEKKGMWNMKTVKIINKTRGNVDMIPGLSDEIKNQYRGKVFDLSHRSINSTESTYYRYEKILTDNYRLIKNQDYLQWLMNFERNIKYPNEGNFGRRWTEKANAYAKVLDESDIVIAPLENNVFNTMKSNLKQVECWTRNLPIVCSDMPPYNVDGKNMENCILIPTKKNCDRDWAKALKKLILDADLRKKLGEQLHEDFKLKYNLADVTKTRVEFYQGIMKKSLEAANQ